MRDGLVNDFIDAFDLVHAHEGIDFRKQLREFLAKTLRQTTGNDQALAAILRFPHLGGFEDGIDALFLRGVDEGAGVDDHDVGAGGVVCDFDAFLHERAEHDFGVHQVFGATERNQADFDRRLFCIFRTH